jgi:glutathione synthase/RimK-type ligase-like ATP-grasp enzyme
MILVITHKEDYTADFLIDIFNKRKIPYYRFNCEDCLINDISLRFGSKQAHKILAGRQFTSVWYRRTKLPVLKGLQPEEAFYLLNEIEAFLSNLFGIIKLKWLSNPAALRLAENKFLQLTIAEEIGLTVPKTLITTDRSELLRFFDSNDRTIIKPINSGRIDYGDNTSRLIFSNVIPKSIADQIETFDLTPAIFQEYIEKEFEIRVTVVGEEVFAAKVYSQCDEEAVIDWRRKKLKFELCDFPEELMDKCKEMIKRLGISFGAFDFIKDRNGGYYFLEVNPNGQWVWIEHDTGLKISDAIINYLV